MRRVNDTIESVTVFPVFKTDFNMRITFTNLSAIPVLSDWGCYEHRKISELMLESCPALLELYDNPESGNLTLFYKGYAISFLVKPFPKQGFIGFYGFQIRYIDKFDNNKQFLN
ncbi:MAG: hypothetical protein HKN22_06830 [Bacteroidia bacterium]|nr:hypothetical protein [Bacteroidia bacterium]